MDTLTPSVLYSAIAGLCATIVFIFRMLMTSQEKRMIEANTSHEKRHTEVLEHHMRSIDSAKTDRQQAVIDRERYVAQLEALVTKIANERDSCREQMIATTTANTEAIRLNTLARESSALQIEKLTHEIISICILKLVELGIVSIPSKPATEAKFKQPK